MDRQSAGFTLIELLVAVGIIGLLLGMLLPALSSARQDAQAVLCAARLSQVAGALQNYVNEQNSFPYGLYTNIVFNQPPPGGWLCASNDYLGLWWFQNLAEYRAAPELEIFWCPARNFEDPGIKKLMLIGNYGINLSICPMDIYSTSRPEQWGRPKTPAQIRSPGSILLLVDSGYATMHLVVRERDLPR